MNEKCIRLDDAEHKHFQRVLGKSFEIRVGKEKAMAELIEVTHHGAATFPGGGRDPFSLVFKLDRGLATESGVYRVEHDRFESMDLLLTPLAPERDASYFEAVFG